MHTLCRKWSTRSRGDRPTQVTEKRICDYSLLFLSEKFFLLRGKSGKNKTRNMLVLKYYTVIDHIYMDSEFIRLLTVKHSTATMKRKNYLQWWKYSKLGLPNPEPQSPRNVPSGIGKLTFKFYLICIKSNINVNGHALARCSGMILRQSKYKKNNQWIHKELEQQINAPLFQNN